jgi:hypothetical protein
MDFEDFMDLLNGSGGRPPRPTPGQFAALMISMALVAFGCAGLVGHGLLIGFFVFCGVVFAIYGVVTIVKIIQKRRRDNWRGW